MGSLEWSHMKFFYVFIIPQLKRKECGKSGCAKLSAPYAYNSVFQIGKKMVTDRRTNAQFLLRHAAQDWNEVIDG